MAQLNNELRKHVFDIRVGCMFLYEEIKGKQNWNEE